MKHSVTLVIISAYKTSVEKKRGNAYVGLFGGRVF
jgi:hypothetical protein